jgi:hypothetical protein
MRQHKVLNTEILILHENDNITVKNIVKIELKQNQRLTFSLGSGFKLHSTDLLYLSLNKPPFK